MPFDLEGALAEGSGGIDGSEGSGDKENQEPESVPAEDDDGLDLETMNKKKKKKKRFNLEELDAALPDAKKDVNIFLFVDTRRTNEQIWSIL